jgi:hypothetical protein
MSDDIYTAFWEGYCGRSNDADTGIRITGIWGMGGIETAVPHALRQHGQTAYGDIRGNITGIDMGSGTTVRRLDWQTKSLRFWVLFCTSIGGTVDTRVVPTKRAMHELTINSERACLFIKPPYCSATIMEYVLRF